MNVLMLDIDGVLNSAASWRAGCHGSGNNAMCPELVARLNRLLSESGAKVVVSSSWRGKTSTTRGILKRNGIVCSMIGCTPRLELLTEGSWYLAYERGREIQAWLDTYRRPVDQFVILDDNNDMGNLLPHLIQINPDIGLQDADVDRALALFRNANKVAT